MVCASLAVHVSYLCLSLGLFTSDLALLTLEPVRTIVAREWVLPTSACQLFSAFPRPARGLEPAEKGSDRLDLPDVDAGTPDGARNDPSDEQHMLNRSDRETQVDPTESTTSRRQLDRSPASGS